MKRKTAIIALIILLTLTIFAQIISPRVSAVDVKITSITPSTQRGKVGDKVYVIGTINSTDGPYQIWFDNILIKSENASGNNVNCSFIVPPLLPKNYTLILRDVVKNLNATSWFIVETNYVLNIVNKPDYPKQLQQKEKVNISIGITGGNASTIYSVNVTVKTPANKTYSKEVQLLTKDDGTGNATVVYPFENAQDSNTNYTGTYTVTANFSGILVSDTFIVGLTDSAEYHRLQNVDIKAAYAPYENVTLTIMGKGAYHSINLTADNEGIVHYTGWSVPQNATIGSYQVSIKSMSNITRKTPPDVQNFTVPGFKIEICTRNLASEVVSNVTLRTYDLWANKTYSDVVSNRTGFAILTLEVGEYNFTVYYRGVKVNQTSVFINQERTFNITCQLTNLRVRVVSAQNMAITIPFVNVTLSCSFTRDLDGKMDKYVNFTLTDITGTAWFHSLLPNVNHIIVASRYGRNFNQTIYKVEQYAWNVLNVTCPVFPMHVNVFDGEGNPIEGATVEAFDLEVGAQYSNRTNRNGNAVLNCIFGKYNVKIYFNRILLNKTKMPVVLFGENVTSPFYCILYNLPIHVKVVDYFGQPIQNANVTLERNGVKINSSITGAGGVATFREIGGTLTIKVYLTNQNLPEATLTAYIGEKRDHSNPVVVKLGNYVVLAGFLVDTAQFAMIILILATMVLVAIIEIARRRFKGKVSS
ncbi:MAG: carboxypeptidase-like regulatory domain-containing protein [Candidatus Bathyarchaeia archaeon]